MKVNNSIKISKFETYQAVRVLSNGNIEKFFSHQIGHQKDYKFDYIDGVGIRLKTPTSQLLIPLANIAQIHYTEVEEESKQEEKKENKRQGSSGGKVADKELK